MHFTPARVGAEHERIRDRAPVVVPLINDTRQRLGEAFERDVADVTVAQYEREVDAVFADGDRAVNVAALAALLRDLDVADDYPGFVVDELLGRELAATVAGEQPLRTLAEATFHHADVHHHGGTPEGSGHDGADDGDSTVAGRDDLDAALAAGFQTRLPGWAWREGPSPFEE